MLEVISCISYPKNPRVNKDIMMMMIPKLWAYVDHGIFEPQDRQDSVNTN